MDLWFMRLSFTFGGLTSCKFAESGLKSFVQMGQHHDQNVKKSPTRDIQLGWSFTKLDPFYHVLSGFFGGGNAAFPTDLKRNKIYPSTLRKQREVKVFNGFHPDNATSIFPQAPLMTSATRVVG